MVNPAVIQVERSVLVSVSVCLLNMSLESYKCYCGGISKKASNNGLHVPPPRRLFTGLAEVRGYQG